jgi:hypothetical protein
MTYTCFKLDALTPSLWRTTFNNPPINLIDVRMVAELRELFVRIQRNKGPAVLIFESADPDYFLAHFDISPANLAELASLPPGPTGLHPWLDILVRLSMLPAVTISAIRGRARPDRQLAVPVSSKAVVPEYFVGDVRAGSVKRVAAAVGDGAHVIAELHDYLSKGNHPKVLNVEARA